MKGYALITGGAVRVGRAIVEDLASNGYAVAIHCRSSREEAEDLRAAITGRGGHAAVVQADLADRAEANDLVRRASDALGSPIDLLVNNASVFKDDTVSTFDADLLRLNMAIHVEAPTILTKQMAAALPNGANGLVVNIIDQRVWKLTPNFYSYTLSKSALWTATRTMAQALAPSIRVNAIGPGPTLKADGQSQEAFDAQVSAVALRRSPDLASFGATIRWMHQTDSMTGQMVALDGGQHLAWQTPDIES